MSTAQPSVHQLYQRLETVGKGAYGSVHKGKHIPTGNVVALKIINLDTADDDVADIQREVALLSQMRDAPNITRYYGCYLDGPRVWIVMEFAQGGSVLSLMKASQDGCIEERFVSVIIREVLTGLNYLHKVPVIHRDMKAANILVTATGKVMICDFGVSALLATNSSKRNTLTGTPYWMAPEVLQSVPAYDTKADIWSLGIMIYEMIKGTPPHSHLDKFQVMDIIPRIKPPRLAENESGKDLRDFMALCLKETPSERLPAEELLKTKWMKSISKIGTSILKELVFRLQQAGPRASLMEPLDWEDGERQSRYSSVSEDHGWEFDTIREGHSPPGLTDEHHDRDDIRFHEYSNSSQDTIRVPTASRNLPSSLRVLFEDNNSEAQSSYRLQQASNRSLAQPDPQPLLPPSSGFNTDEASRDTASNMSITNRTRRRRSKTFLNERGTESGSPVSNDPILLPPPQSSLGDDTYDKGLGAVEVFQHERGAGPALGASLGNILLEIEQFAHDKHSDGVTYHKQPALDLASPSAFQFPPLRVNKPFDWAPSRSPQSPQQETTPRSVSTSSMTHQNSLSLDTLSISPGLDAPAYPQARSRSATTPPLISFVEHDSLSVSHRTAPIPHPETRVVDHHAQFQHSSLGTPGLKDVLKIPSLSSEHRVGMADLLPPSPSAIVSSSRHFTSESSHLNLAVSFSDDEEEGASPANGELPEVVGTSRVQHNRADSMQAFPPIIPLDYPALILDEEACNKKLGHTVKSLAHWLAVMEAGFNSMLDNAIEEEQETSSSDSLDASMYPSLSYMQL